MKKLLKKALAKWFTGAAADRLAGALLDALLGALTGGASPKVISALRSLVLALAQERSEKATATIAADLSRQGLAAINAATVAAVEMGELAARLRELLPPEDPRIHDGEAREDWRGPDGWAKLAYRDPGMVEATAPGADESGFAGPIGDAVPPEPWPDEEDPSDDASMMEAIAPGADKLP